jgi:hypothetical protein
MSDDSNELMFGDEVSSGHPQPDDPASVLSWALIDEQINEDEFRLLDTLLLSDESARKTYVGCVQLHVDLMSHFESEQYVDASGTAAKSSVLGFLNEIASPLGAQRPSINDARTQ